MKQESDQQEINQSDKLILNENEGQHEIDIEEPSVSSIDVLNYVEDVVQMVKEDIEKNGNRKSD
jgi:hypothetical protein